MTKREEANSSGKDRTVLLCAEQSRKEAESKPVLEREKGNALFHYGRKSLKPKRKRGTDRHALDGHGDRGGGV